MNYQHSHCLNNVQGFSGLVERNKIKLIQILYVKHGGEGLDEQSPGSGGALAS